MMSLNGPRINSKSFNVKGVNNLFVYKYIKTILEVFSLILHGVRWCISMNVNDRSVIYELNSNEYSLDVEYIKLLNSLKKYRIYSGVSQKELADKSGLDLRTIARVESSNPSVSLKTSLKYIKGLGLDLEIF